MSFTKVSAHYNESATNTQVANLDHDYLYSKSLLLHPGGVNQLGIRYLAQGRNTLSLDM